MSGVNKVILIGRLGKDPEVRSLESGVSVANFTMATTETYRDRNSGEKKEITEWHNIVVWRGLADVASKYLHKGDQVYIEGKIRSRSYEKEGQTKYITEIVADNLTMLGSKGSGSSGTSSQEYGNAAGATNQKQDANSPDSHADDLPF
jgi:single-strand DNA-binding protein